MPPSNEIFEEIVISDLGTNYMKISTDRTNITKTDCNCSLTVDICYRANVLPQTSTCSSLQLPVSVESGSNLSLYSDAGDFGNVAVQGGVEFSLRYNDTNKEFVIWVEQCCNLACANRVKKRTDPYVKTYLYPDKTRSSKRKTAVKKNTVNPIFKQALKYKIKKSDLQTRTLNLSSWHNDALGRNVFLGEVEVDLRYWDWSNEHLNWYNLKLKSIASEVPVSRGRLSISLRFIPAGFLGKRCPVSGEIHIWLRKAYGLQALRPSGADSFVKCYMLPDTSKKCRQKTRVVKECHNPVYNHTMIYDGFRHDEANEACAELTIWDHDTFTNQFLGGVRLSLGTGRSYGKQVEWMDSNKEESTLWMNMLSKPNEWVEADLPLRLVMTSRK